MKVLIFLKGYIHTVLRATRVYEIFYINMKIINDFVNILIKINMLFGKRQ